MVVVTVTALGGVIQQAGGINHDEVGGHLAVTLAATLDPTSFSPPI